MPLSQEVYFFSFFWHFWKINEGGLNEEQESLTFSRNAKGTEGTVTFQSNI